MNAVVSTLASFDPVVQALLAATVTWAATAVGAAVVFFVRSLDKRLLDTMLGFAAGVMIAASFWSLLAPAIEMAEGGPLPAWMPATLGFLAGSASLWGLDRILPHLHLDQPMERAEGIRTPWRRTTLLILAITLHNIPEGLAVGVAFGAAAAGLPSATFAGALVLALGMALQNVPEGAAVALPLRREGISRMRSFWYGQLSGAVEPLAAVLGAAVVLQSRTILPYALAFAAGAMIYVVLEELIPEAQCHGDTDRPTLGAIAGFALMMTLDTAFA